MTKIIYHHRTQGAGAEGIHISGVIKGFRELGHTVSVVSPPGVDAEKTADSNPYSKEKNGISKILSCISRILPQFLFEGVEILYNLRVYCKILNLINKNNIDFIYERHAFFSFAATRLAKKLKIPIIIEVNEVAGEKRIRKQCFINFAKRLEKYVFKNAGAIIVVSEFLKDRIKEYGVDEDKIFVIPNAIDRNRFSPEFVDPQVSKQYCIKNHALIAGFIGSFVDWHNIELLIDVFEEISGETDLLLLLVGDGILKPKLKNMVKNKNIENKVVFTGLVPHKHIPACIDLMDLCIIPQSNQYRSPIKMFEYMAMGKAVVAPRLNPIESIIKHKVNGMLFIPGDKESLRLAILNLINNRQEREDIGIKARNTICEKHLWKNNAAKTIEIYGKIRAKID